MKILFVHGMGATRFDCFPTFMRLKKLGYDTATFSYFSSFQNLDSIKNRLTNRVVEIASHGDYAVIGHSLGGILLRDILQNLPSGVREPRHLFLVGSPMIATQANKSLSRFVFYKFLSGQCGQLVASQELMEAIGLPSVPTTCVVGTKGFRGRYSPLGDRPNDSIVLESELCTGLFSDVVRIAARHPFLPASPDLWPIIHDRLNSKNHAGSHLCPTQRGDL
jgi:hypothetical protein